MNLEPLPPGAVPLPFNPVWRSYAGGRALRQFRGQLDSADDHFPEDWLASTVRARNSNHSQGPDEGLSYIGDPVTERGCLSRSSSGGVGGLGEIGRVSNVGAAAAETAALRSLLRTNVCAPSGG